MISELLTLSWPLLILYFLHRLELNYVKWEEKKQPMNLIEIEKMNRKLEDLQSQISRLSMDKGFTE